MCWPFFVAVSKKTVVNISQEAINVGKLRQNVVKLRNSLSLVLNYVVIEVVVRHINKSGFG